MSTGDKTPDSALSKKNIDDTITSLIDSVKIDSTHWVPYLGGYSKNWAKPEVFFDARFPDTLKVDGKELIPQRYILIHECVEKCLMDELNMSYEHAHDIATSAERSAVEADGFTWGRYTDALKPYINEAIKKPVNLEAPKDLDLSPYEQEHAKVIKQLEQ